MAIAFFLGGGELHEVKISFYCKEVHFQQTHNQGLRYLLLTVSLDLRAQLGTPHGVLCIFVVPEACTRRVEAP